MVKHGKATKAAKATHPQKPQKPQKPQSQAGTEKTEKKLDDGWPESVEEQSLLLYVWRHYIITRQYIISRREE